ncbi:MAG: beta-galactosidase trimerization domain-containing protein, partial [Terriglobia bacterium]
MLGNHHYVSLLVAGLILSACASAAVAADAPASADGSATVTPTTADPYERYVDTSKDFARVKQDKDWLYTAYPSWLYMPFYYRWKLGYNDAGGKFLVDTGYNGSFVDRGDTRYLAWIDKFELHFLAGHTAGKGDMHLWSGGQTRPHKAEYTGTGVRPVPLNAATLEKLEGTIKTTIDKVKSSPYRAAYSLDDETSWGVFVDPCMWRVNADAAAYQAWLAEIYGQGHAPGYKGWISYDAIRTQLDDWTIGSFDPAQLMDQWTYNDSVWCNFLGDLVAYANQIDPHTPCGVAGGQNPSPFGYDYAKLMRKVQFLEAYNNGSSQAVARSFNPHNAIPLLTTHFFKSAPDTIWQFYYYLAHGNRGHIGWMDDHWWKGDQPADWQKEVSPVLMECGKKLGPLQAQSEWLHDGVAIYYSQASIQLGWIMDAESHGKTWVNRDSDSDGAATLVRKAWENMLRDSGIQYNFLSYADVIRHGVPKEYKVLILPATLCLSAIEAEQIEAFCQSGGTVIADYLPGCWDQHGRGYKNGGVLDKMFGVDISPDLKSADVFQTTGWYEVNQETHYQHKTYTDMLSKNSCIFDKSGFNKCIRKMDTEHVAKFGKGTTVLLNLSPQWYNAYREQGFEAAGKRDVFMKYIEAAGVHPWVRID